VVASYLRMHYLGEGAGCGQRRYYLRYTRL